LPTFQPVFPHFVLYMFLFFDPWSRWDGMNFEIRWRQFYIFVCKGILIMCRFLLACLFFKKKTHILWNLLVFGREVCSNIQGINLKFQAFSSILFTNINYGLHIASWLPPIHANFQLNYSTPIVLCLVHIKNKWREWVPFSHSFIGSEVRTQLVIKFYTKIPQPIQNHTII
jgi:hypothetical protein